MLEIVSMTKYFTKASFVLSCLQVKALRRAGHLSKESYQMPK